MQSSQNIPAYYLIDSITKTPILNLKKLAEAQKNDPEKLQNSTISLKVVTETLPDF